MRTRTLMWNTFMTRGQNKCIIMAQYKGKEEDAYIPPNSFEKSYEELGIHSGCQITLIEFRKKPDDSSDDGEGGEDDMEDMEAEMEEGDEDEQAAEEEDAEKPEGEAAEEDEKPDGEEKDEAEGEAKEGGEQKVQADAPAESAPAGERPTAAQQLDMP